MRILQVIPVYDSYHVFLRDWVGRLVSEGHEVLTVCDCQQRLLPFAMDSTFPLRHMDFPRGANPWQQWRAARRLRAVIREFQPDVVHAHFSSAILVTALARFGHKRFGHKRFGHKKAQAVRACAGSERSKGCSFPWRRVGAAVVGCNPSSRVINL